MELKEFANLMSLDSSKQAKSIMDTLISVSKSGDQKSSYGLSSLYKSFPENVKNKKDFLPVIVKYFHFFKLDENNEDIFKEYYSLMSPKFLDSIKEKNPQWNFKEEFKVDFKNVLEFVRAMPKFYSGYSYFEFIERHKEQFNKFVNCPKNHKKTLEHFGKQSVWEKLMAEDYFKFNSFCKEYCFDKNIIFENYFKSKFYSFYKMGTIKDETIDIFLSDFNDFKNKSNNLELNDKLFDNNKIYYDFLKTVYSDNFYAALKFLIYFEKNIQEYFNKKNENYKSFDSSENLKDAIKEDVKNSSNSFVGGVVNLKESVLEKEEWFRYYDAFNLQGSLNKGLSANSKVKRKTVKV